MENSVNILIGYNPNADDGVYVSVSQNQVNDILARLHPDVEYSVFSEEPAEWHQQIEDIQEFIDISHKIGNNTVKESIVC